ncbi:DH domain-containing protein [Mycena indigotica]|uniref:DH domain-containing protein n=1 Tax=Mycena indigotica TaxID=2126181 RepID=A0A8H6VWB6_9AGAR|nr:DH domain-containing protein [Mycena indigotica]KAF7290604.1 DH domain-containing protein [Mycena indigotica]
MPLNRRKSHSPLPPSPRPATFFPPSHYAEAGGLTPRRQTSHPRDEPPPSRPNTSYMPIASNSESSFEFAPKSPEPSRISTVNSKTSLDKKGESHMKNLPFVEAQLLPSLRDTINRMTRPPVKTTALSPSHIGSNNIGFALSPDHEPQLSPQPPKQLKSALRSPTPKLQLQTARMPLSASNSPREMTSTVQVDIPPTPKRTRPRSRTDPGTPMKTENNPNSPRAKVASGIPRLRGKNGLMSASSTPRPRQYPLLENDSSSDFELRSEQRSLRVVNGVLSSESESESDGEFGQMGLGLGLGINPPYQPRSSFASKLRARITNDVDSVDEAAERRRKELLGLVQGISHLEQQVGHSADPEYPSEGKRTHSTPRLLVSSSSGIDGELDRGVRPLSFWNRSKTHSESTTKSPSRSPVIRQSPNATPRTVEQSKIPSSAIPAAIRRHSIYYAKPPSPSVPSPPLPQTPATDEEEYSLVTQSPESIYDDEETWSPNPPMLSHLRPPKDNSQHHRQSDDLAKSDAVLLALNSRLDAAREREAFGLPPSVSDVGARERLSYLDSESELARARWDEEDGTTTNRRGMAGLSIGADNLFRALGARTVDAQIVSEHNWRDRDRRRDRSSSLLDQEDVRVAQGTRQQSVVQTVNLYDDEERLPQENRSLDQLSSQSQRFDEVQQHQPIPSPPSKDAWQASLPASVYASVVDRYGTLEIRRQETIHDLVVSEEAFVSRLNHTVRLFVLPLRMQDSKDYVAGVPTEIGMLFDWLEDLLNLHTQLLAALRKAQQTQQPVVERLAGIVLESFVKQLEVYQPYLARLVGIAGTIARLVADALSDFGEFVRIQESVQEWSLEALLVAPVTRLGGYPTIFRILLEETPQTHIDYIPTFMLLHATESMIQIMTEVKVREDEYDAVKSVSQSVHGLPCVAKRGRKLLHQGQLELVDTISSVSHAQRTPSLHQFPDRLSSTSFPKSRSTRPPIAQEQLDSPAAPIQVFVFTDLIVFASNSKRRSRHDLATEEWTIMERNGVVGILNVSEDDSVIVLDVAPLSFKELEEPSIMPHAPLQVVKLRIPASTLPKDSELELFKTWLAAFQLSSKLTIRALSLPKISIDYRWPEQDFQVPPPPLPKSPSMIAQGTVPHKQEREERTWWSRRFHDVLSQVHLRE